MAAVRCRRGDWGVGLGSKSVVLQCWGLRCGFFFFSRRFWACGDEGFFFLWELAGVEVFSQAVTYWGIFFFLFFSFLGFAVCKGG